MSRLKTEERPSGLSTTTPAMTDQNKTREQLIDKLLELRVQIAALGKAESERKQLEDLLERERQTFFPILHKAPYGIGLMDKEGKFLYINPEFTHITGFTLEDVHAGRDWFNRAIQFSQYRQEMIEAWQKGAVQRGIEKVFSIMCKEGEVRDVEIRPTLLDDGRMIIMLSDITDHKRTEEALRKSEERYRLLVENANDTIFIAQDGLIKTPNIRITQMMGYSPEEIDGEPFIKFIHPEDAEMVFSKDRDRISGASNHPAPYAFRIISKTGKVLWVELSTALIEWEGRPATLNVLRDITERKRVEEEMTSLQQQLRQSQKMEAIGKLAGGIAHDFNNLLTIIKGYTQFSLMESQESSSLKGNLEEILRAADHASNLTRQILAFSRRQIMEFKVLDLNMILQNLEKMLRRVIGEDIELLFLQTKNLGRVRVDPGQMEQVLINLAVNARDAMPKGGKLIIETCNVELDEEYARAHVAVSPGSYVMLSVSDNGEGMTPEVKEQVFEPFFTTKGKGKGTGLGLSTVYGIVKQSGGNIWVYSELGKGTTFKIYLPRVDEPVEEPGKRVIREGMPQGSETVLVVEDNEEVRTFAVLVLKRQGYKTLEASNGDEALHLCEGMKESIHLILTDVVMPGMNGCQLVEHLRQGCRDLKALYMSGYTDNAVIHHGVLEKGMDYIQKPFTIEALSRKVREVLDK